MPDNHVTAPAPDEETLKLMRERVYGYLFPNVPQTAAEKAAFEQAVLWQYEHDYSLLQRLNGMPGGVESFRIGDFQMAFQEGVLDSALNRKNICPSVYGLLLRHGLLYRGVEGRMPYAVD